MKINFPRLILESSQIVADYNGNLTKDQKRLKSKTGKSDDVLERRVITASRIRNIDTGNGDGDSSAFEVDMEVPKSGANLSSGSSVNREEVEADNLYEEVEVVHIENPNKIHVRNVAATPSWVAFRLQIRAEALNSPHLTDTPVRGQHVLCDVEGRWERGVVKEIIAENVKVKLVDVGRMADVPHRNLRQLSRKLKNAECLTEIISVVGAKPDNGEHWRRTTVQMFKERVPIGTKLLIKRFTGIEAEVFIKPSAAEVLGKNVKVSSFLMTPQESTNQDVFMMGRMSPTFALSPSTSPSPVTASPPTVSPATASTSSVCSSPLIPDPEPADILPLHPRDRSFAATLTHIDRHGVVWVVPADRDEVFRTNYYHFTYDYLLYHL